MIAAAVAKINGFAYAPDPNVFWKQGYSHDNSYIFVTTQYLTVGLLDEIAAEIDPFEKLLICAPAFDIGLGRRYAQNPGFRTEQVRIRRFRLQSERGRSPSHRRKRMGGRRIKYKETGGNRFRQSPPVHGLRP